MRCPRFTSRMPSTHRASTWPGQSIPCPNDPFISASILGDSLGNKSVLKGLKRDGIRWDKLLKTGYGRKDSYAHNPKVAGSNPALATNSEGRKALISFALGPSTLPHIRLSIHPLRLRRQG